MTLLLCSTQLLLALVAACFTSAMVPVYAMPFGGCPSEASLFEYPGCSFWPNLIRGALFAAGFLIFAPRTFKPHLIATGIITVLSVFGGFEGLQSGMHFEIDSLSYALNVFLYYWPFFTGGMILVGMSAALNRLFDRQRVSDTL